MKKTILVTAIACVMAFNSGVQAVTIDFVNVGNPGNAADDTGYGSVNYEYRIGKYEVTAGQYTEFLNAVAATDTYGLYNTAMADISLNGKGCNILRMINGVIGGNEVWYTYSVAADWANRPVNYVSWYDTLRFANWLHNGQPTGGQTAATTEDGAYDMSLGSSVVRKAGATVWLPSEGEWYKAAYHKNDGVTGNYFDYPTSSDSVPSNDLVEPTDPGNNATFKDSGNHTIGSPYYRTEVGAHENSDSPYGTFDMGGNVFEWNEAFFSDSYRRCMRGGSHTIVNVAFLKSDSWMYLSPEYEDSWVGFRLASVPEPSALEVAVNIKPDSCPNPLNVKSKGVLPVAILGSEGFDVNTVDLASIRLADVAPIRSSYEDVATPVVDGNECECTTKGPDGYADLTLKFETGEIVNALGDVNDGDVRVLTLTGVLFDTMPFETPIEGADCIVIRGKAKSLHGADINKDGVVDMADFAIFAQNWLQSSVVDE